MLSSVTFENLTVLRGAWGTQAAQQDKSEA